MVLNSNKLLAQTCFADARVALSQHFRCVPQCIAFSNEQFYHGRLQPRRLPPLSERLAPALVDKFVPGGKKKGKINEGEAQALVDYLQEELEDGAKLAERGATVGIISLMGMEQVWANSLLSLVFAIPPDNNQTEKIM